MFILKKKFIFKMEESSYSNTDPLLNSRYSIDVYCIKCDRIMNNNYYYDLGPLGSASGYLCPDCYIQMTPPKGKKYVKYVYKPRPRKTNDNYADDWQICPFCPII